MIQTWEIVMGLFCILYWSILLILQWGPATGIFIDGVVCLISLFPEIYLRQQGEFGRWSQVCQPQTLISPVPTTTVNSPPGDWNAQTRGFNFISFPIIHTMSLDPWRTCGWLVAWRVSMLRWIKRTDLITGWRDCLRLALCWTAVESPEISSKFNCFSPQGKLNTTQVF